MEPKKQIFFHVGLAKTGSTFLQERLFPHLENIWYLPTHKYKRASSLISQSKAERVLVSREFDRQFDEAVKTFAEVYPDAVPLIIFRQHHSYIASQYRRFVKNGYRGSFTEFIDIENDTGFFKIRHLDYKRHIRYLEEHFSEKPIVILYDALKNNPQEFAKKISSKISAKLDTGKINFKRKHTSYSEKQLKAVFAFGKYVNLRKRRYSRHAVLHFFAHKLVSVLRYGTLFFAKFIPSSFFGDEPLIKPEETEQIENYFRADWEYILKSADIK